MTKICQDFATLEFTSDGIYTKIRLFTNIKQPTRLKSDRNLCKKKIHQGLLNKNILPANRNIKKEKQFKKITDTQNAKYFHTKFSCRCLVFDSCWMLGNDSLWAGPAELFLPSPVTSPTLPRPLRPPFPHCPVPAAACSPCSSPVHSQSTDLQTASSGDSGSPKPASSF